MFSVSQREVRVKMIKQKPSTTSEKGTVPALSGKDQDNSGGRTERGIGSRGRGRGRGRHSNWNKNFNNNNNSDAPKTKFEGIL